MSTSFFLARQRYCHCVSIAASSSHLNLFWRVCSVFWGFSVKVRSKESSLSYVCHSGYMNLKTSYPSLHSTWPNLQLWYVFLALRVYPTYICQTSASGPWELLVSFSLKLEITIKGSYAYGQVRLYFHIEQNEMPQKCRSRRVRLPNLNLNLKPAELALNTSISQQ